MGRLADYKVLDHSTIKPAHILTLQIIWLNLQKIYWNKSTRNWVLKRQTWWWNDDINIKIATIWLMDVNQIESKSTAELNMEVNKKEKKIQEEERSIHSFIVSMSRINCAKMWKRGAERRRKICYKVFLLVLVLLSVWMLTYIVFILFLFLLFFFTFCALYKQQPSSFKINFVYFLVVASYACFFGFLIKRNFIIVLQHSRASCKICDLIIVFCSVSLLTKLSSKSISFKSMNDLWFFPLTPSGYLHELFDVNKMSRIFISLSLKMSLCFTNAA